MSKNIKSVCVFCGSRPGVRDSYQVAARQFGASLAREGWRLVYGAGDVGLMGEVARATRESGGTVFGVIPKHLTDLEIVLDDIDSLVVTETMHERKKVMFMNSDAIVALPGGAGTLDELFEAITWRQLGLHDKPVTLLDVDGYWSGVLDVMDGVIECGFADPSLRTLFSVEETVESLVASLRKDLT